MKGPRWLLFFFWPLVLAFVVLLPLSASAQVNVNPNGITSMPDLLRQVGGQTIGTTTVGGKPAAVISGPIIGSVVGKPLEVVARNIITGPNIARTAGAVAQRLVLPLGVATVLHSAYCQAGGTGWLCDPGEEKVPELLWCFPSPSTVCARTPEGIATAEIERQLTAWELTWGSSAVFVRSGTVACRPIATGRVECVGLRSARYSGTTMMGAFEPGVQLVQRTDLACAEGRPMIPGTALCVSGELEPATETDLATRVAPAIESDIEAVVRELQRIGEDLRTYSRPQELTGPARTVGEPTTTTTTKPDGTVSTETKQPTYHHTYNTNNTITTITTITTTKDDGTVTEEQKPPDETPPAVDPDMPEVPDLYEQKYPDGVAGVWQEKRDAMRETGLFALVDSMVPDLGSGGCPTWSIPVLVGFGSVSSYDLSVPCWVWDFCKVFVMVCALILSRKIVFGG